MALVVAVTLDRCNGLVRLLVLALVLVLLVLVIVVGTSRRCTRREDDIAGGRGVVGATTGTAVGGIDVIVVVIVVVVVFVFVFLPYSASASFKF